MDSGLFLEFPCRDNMSEGEAFAEGLALIDAAEACGVDSVWLAEYHFSPISVLSAPITVASAIAARTQRIRLGLAVALLPLGHPMRFAEEIATLDHLSQGRVEFGIGCGTFPPETSSVWRGQRIGHWRISKIKLFAQFFEAHGPCSPSASLGGDVGISGGPSGCA